MKNIKKEIFLPLTFMIAGCIPSIKAQDCGEKRWDVKTLSDADTSSIDFFNIINSSVHQQIFLPKPNGKISQRMQSEDTVYSLNCYIIAFKKEKDDKDIHIVIKDALTNETMVAEIISSDCLSVQKTSRFPQIKELDEWFIENIGKPTSSFHYPENPILVQITGVGFFDFVHGQKGMALNGREIHPVLSMKLGEAPKAEKY